MESITKWLQSAIPPFFPEVDLSVLPGKANGKLKLSPEQLLEAIQAQAVNDN